MPKRLPEDLFTGQIGRELKDDLGRFHDGAMDRETILNNTRDRVEVAMSTIAASLGCDPRIDKLPRKE